jgi:beta-N-acetylhexosaminidase
MTVRKCSDVIKAYKWEIPDEESVVEFRLGEIMQTLKCFLIVLMTILLAFTFGCGEVDHKPAIDRPPAEARFGYSASLDAEQRAWVKRTLSELTVREMASQVIVEWVAGSYISTDSEDFDKAVALVESGVGGLWMMGGLPHSRTAKLNELQSRAKIPMLVMGSETLGKHLYAPWRDRRDRWILGGGTDIPSSMAYGAIGDPSAVREAARIFGMEARATGVSFIEDGGVNVLTNLANVLHNRVYGDDPDQAGRLAAAFVEGGHDAGLLNYVGFFPGVGDLDADPHIVLPVIQNDRQHFEAVDFVPFHYAIQAGVDIVMTSHIAVPGLTGSDTLPATLSPEVIRILREELGFDGLVLTDAFDMGALTNNYEHLDAAIQAFKAGHDLLLGPRSFEVADKLAELVESGEIPLGRLRASVRRILEAKARIGLHKNRMVSLEAVNEVVGRREHQQAAYSAADRSIVLLRDREKLIPLSTPSDIQVLSVTFEREDNKVAGNGFNGVLSDYVNSVDAVRMSPSSDPSIYDDLRRRAQNVDRVVLSVYLRPQLGVDHQVELSDAFVKFVRRLQEEGRDVVLISFGMLTVLDRLPDLGTFMLAWSEQQVMQRAAARALLGITPISGRLPVALPPHHRTGDGLEGRR